MKSSEKMLVELIFEDIRKSGRCYIRKNGAEILEHLVGASWEPVVFEKKLAERFEIHGHRAKPATGPIGNPPTGGSNVKKSTP
jgi:hypothetical protein